MIRVVRLEFKSQHTNDFKQLFEDRKEKIRGVPGCTYLELWQDHLNENVFYTYSHWQEPQHLDDYRLSEFFKDTWTTIKPWFNGPAQAFSAQTLQQLA